MSSNPGEFARRVLAAFEAAGHATDEEVGDAGGPSTTTLAKYRKVANGEMSMTEPRGDVLRRIDTAANWRSGSARSLWRDQKNPEPPRPSLGELLGARAAGSGRTVRVDSPENYVQWLAERLTEVEERLDLLTEEIRASGSRATVSALPARGGDGNADDPRGPASMNDELSEGGSTFGRAAKTGDIQEPGEPDT